MVGPKFLLSWTERICRLIITTSTTDLNGPSTPLVHLTTSHKLNVFYRSKKCFMNKIIAVRVIENRDWLVGE